MPLLKTNRLKYGFMCLYFSSNGKSVTWAANERGYRPNLWKRISIHIKKKEETNQTAIIKPFSKDCDAPGDGSMKMGNKGHQQAVECHPVGTYRPRTPSPLPTVSQRTSLRAREDDGAGVPAGDGGERQERVVALPSYMSERQREQQHQALMLHQRQLQQHHLPPSHPQQQQQRGGSPPQGSIMDQISCVVHRFTANISELNSMMLPGSSGPPGGASSAGVGGGNALGGLPSSPSPSFLIQHEMQLPATVTTYAEVVAVSNVNPHALGGSLAAAAAAAANRMSPSRLMSGSTFKSPPVSVVATTAAANAAAAIKPPEMEELVALQPPSPFRDSSLGSASESSTSLASQAAAGDQQNSPDYDRLMLRHYSQSSSSL